MTSSKITHLLDLGWLLALGAAFVFLVAMLLAAATGRNVKPSPLRIRAWHHEYLGAALFLLGLPLPLGLRIPLQVIGIVFMWDDSAQHAIQFATDNLAYRSPLHRWYRGGTAGWTWLRRLEEWLDARFGTSR